MTSSLKLVRGSLVLVFAMCLIMVTLGGYVRLSGSGFSIPEWPLFTVGEKTLANGEVVKQRTVIPPADIAGWTTLRDIFVHHEPTMAGITVDDFKSLFWVEWSHRCLASLIGLAYVTFMILTAVNPAARQAVGALSIAGFFLLLSQALVGGVVIILGVKATEVALHLVVAFLFISLVLWMMMKLSHPPLPASQRPRGNSILKWAIAIYTIVIIQIFSGGLMAASRAGYQMQTWPRMGDQWIPSNLQIAGDSLVKNFTENIIMIQFWHRWYAMFVAVAILFFVARCMTVKVSKVARWALRGLFTAVVLQITLGILVLLSKMNTHVALTHQMVGLFVMLVALILIYETANHEVVMERAIVAHDESSARASGRAARHVA